MKKSLLVIMAMCGLWLLNGCGSGSSTPPPATHFSVTSANAAPTAGVPFNITVTALDAAGQMVATYSGTVQLTSSNGKPVQPASGAVTNGTGTFSVTLNTAGSQTITATAATLTGTSNSINVGAAAATQFSVTAPATATAGAAFSFTVTAQDGSNNVVTSYSGTVHFSSSDAQAALPGNATLTNGTGTFSATLKTANSENITATDTATASITGSSAAINVSAGPATHFSVTAPTAVTVGISFSFSVTAMDAFSNTATGYTGMVHFSTNDAQVVPPANSALAGGAGNFSITLKAVQNTTVTATDTVTATIIGSSNPINVVSNAVTHLAMANPSDATTRATLSFTVSALDAANNVSPGYSGTLHFTSTDAQALLPANSTLSNGAQSFSATFENGGNQTITATDSATASLKITSSSIAVTAALTLAITSGSPPAGTFGAVYGPVTTENFRCTRNTSGVVICTPCSGTTNCSALPLCHRNPTYPCRFTRQVSLGFPLTAAGGVPQYKWSATGLPPGLGLSVNLGSTYIAGTPTSPGSYTVVVTVTDSGTPQVTSPANTYTIVINEPPPPVINATPAPPFGAVNLPYSFTFTATSSALPLTWRMSAGTPPAGLTLSPAGVLSGTPTAIGTTSMTLIATDEFKQDSTPQVFSIQIFAHGFKATGSMAGPRIAHTATLLNSGKVLVAGGTDASGTPLATAELYDPTTKTFSTTGSMGTARHHFAATLLPNGKVLVTGGLDTSGNPLMTAELYDPAAGTFSPTTGGMHFVHASHTATLLNTGKVLVVGWGNAVAELFDPATGTFAPTGSMVAARVSHTATLLKSGKVLVAGGIGQLGGVQGVLKEAELYDPTTGSFSQTLGSLATARQWHTASLLKDGTVLVTGGMDDNAGHAIATAELFDPTTQMFAATKGGMETARAFQTATVQSDGTVLVTGGDSGTGALATAEVYDATAQTFSPTGDMETTRESHTATLLNDGTVLVTGGSGGGPATAEVYQ